MFLKIENILSQNLNNYLLIIGNIIFFLQKKDNYLWLTYMEYELPLVFREIDIYLIKLINLVGTIWICTNIGRLF